MRHVTLADIFGAGIGDPWLAWNAKIDALPDGAVLLDHLGRSDWPGDDETWAKFVKLQHQVRRLCNADLGAGWAHPEQPPPERIPAGMWQGIGALDPSPAVDHVGAWVSDWHASGKDSWRGLLLVGPVGTGKTALAAALAHDTDPYAFWPVTDLIAHLHEGYQTNAFAARIDQFTRRRILILDDLGAERDTPDQIDLVSRIIDARHRKRRLTVVTTNLRRDLRVARYGQRVDSRLGEMCEVVALTGQDRRLGAANPSAEAAVNSYVPGGGG